MAKIVVLAGVNGAGKSSVAGASLRQNGGDFYNPDEAAAAHLRSHPESSQSDANAIAWKYGFAVLERIIREGVKDQVFNFETTLGGTSICDALVAACAKGHDVHIWFVGLSSPDLHIERVAERVASGGHDIPAEKIRERYPRAIANVIRLLPVASSVQVFDNSVPKTAGGARPERLLLVRNGTVLECAPSLSERNRWAAPILGAALKQAQK